MQAVNDVTFHLLPGETLGIVGESGCGKSVTALSILRLIPQPPGKIIAGGIYLDEQNLLTLPLERIRRIRGKDISMIFQEPMTSLNPVLTVGKQIAEAVQLHEGVSRSQAWEKTSEMLHLVGIPSPGQRVRDYPHQLSGGMRQRVMIAMALSCNPKDPHRRRAHHGSGRDDPGPDPPVDFRSSKEIWDVGHVDHPRFGNRLPDRKPGHGHVHGKNCRNGRCS